MIEFVAALVALILFVIAGIATPNWLGKMVPFGLAALSLVVLVGHLPGS